MNLQTIHEHTIDLDLLSGGICIDVGCRGFQFSEAMRDLGLKVIAFDLEDMQTPEGIEYIKAAVSNEVKMGFYKDTKDPQAKHLADAGVPIRVTTMGIIYESLQEAEPDLEIDVLKLDCEGSEYAILSDPNFQPIPKQLSIEFHEHCFPALHGTAFESCIGNLTKHYVPVQHERYRAHGAGANYWDSLFIRKDLL